MDKEMKVLPIGKGHWMKKGKDLTILAIGNRVYPALKAAEILKEQGINAGVINMRFAKPLDVKIIKEAVKISPNLVSVEDNVLAGGFGSAIAEALADNGLKADLLRLGVKDNFVEHGKQAELYEDIGLSAQEIAKAAAKKFK